MDDVIQPPASSLQHPTSNVQRPTLSIVYHWIASVRMDSLHSGEAILQLLFNEACALYFLCWQAYPGYSHAATVAALLAASQ